MITSLNDPIFISIYDCLFFIFFYFFVRLRMIPVFQASNVSNEETLHFKGKTYVRVKPSDFVGRDSFVAHFRSVFNPNATGVPACPCGVAKGCGYCWGTCGLLLTVVGIPAALCLLHTATRAQQHGSTARCCTMASRRLRAPTAGRSSRCRARGWSEQSTPARKSAYPSPCPAGQKRPSRWSAS